MLKLDPGTFVFPRQLTPGDITALAAAGIRLVVNNRPDGEEPAQPASAEIEAAARAAGLDYRHIPISSYFRPEHIEAMASALEKGPVLAFCRSGTRSTWLWALARAASGAEPDALIGQAAAAGYDLSPLIPQLRR